MLFGGNWEKFLWEGIIFLILLQAGLLLFGQDPMLVLTRVTYSFTFGLLSDHGRLDGRHHRVFPYEGGRKAPHAVAWEADRPARLEL